MPLPRDTNGNAIQASPNWVLHNNVAIGATSTQSAAFATGTRAIRICPTVDCYVAVGTSPTAATTTAFVPAGAVEYLGIEAGASWKIAVIQTTTAGSLTVVEVA